MLESKWIEIDDGRVDCDDRLDSLLINISYLLSAQADGGSNVRRRHTSGLQTAHFQARCLDGVNMCAPACWDVALGINKVVLVIVCRLWFVSSVPVQTEKAFLGEPFCLDMNIGAQWNWWETRSSRHMCAADWTAARRSTGLSTVSLSCCVWWTLLKTICWDPKICSGRVAGSAQWRTARCALPAVVSLFLTYRLFFFFFFFVLFFCSFSSSYRLCLWPAAVNVEQTCRCAVCVCVCVCVCVRRLLQPIKGPTMRPKFENVSTQFIP